MSSFQPRAYSKQGEFRDLLNLIDELKAELESRKEACKRLKAENLRVEKEKKDAEKHLFALETGRASTSTMGASAKQRAIQRAAKEQHRELQAMSMKAAKASEEAEGLRQALDEASERLKSLEEDVGALREERDAAREEGEELRDQLARVGWEKEQELNKLQAEKDREIEEKGNEAEQRLEAAYAEHGKELSQLSDHYETLEADKIALEELLRNREQELERATASVHSSKVSPEEVKWQVVSVSREGSVKEVSATEEFEFFSFETTLEIVLKGLSGEFFSETLFAIGSLSKPGIHSNFRIPKGTQPFLVLNTKLLVEVSQSSETGELIPLQDSELELRFFSAAETFLGVWTEGPRGDCKVAAFAAYLGEENTAIALFEVDDSNGGLAYSHGLLNCAPQKAQQPDLARGEFLVEISRMDGQRLEAARSSGMFNVGKRKVTRNDENGRERTFEVWQVIEGRAERTAELQGCGFRDVDAGAGAAHSPLSGAGAVAEAAIPLTPAPQPGGGRGPHGLKPFPLRRPSDGGQGSGVGELTACLRFVSAVPPLREPLEGRRSAGSDAEGVAEAPNHHPPMDAAAVPPESAAAAPPAKAAATLVEAAAAVRGCLRELLGMSPSPADDDEAVDRAEAAVDRARAELREAEASVRLCDASTARELGAACDSSADITAIAVSSQAAAAREAAEAAMAGARAAVVVLPGQCAVRRRQPQHREGAGLPVSAARGPLPGAHRCPPEARRCLRRRRLCRPGGAKGSMALGPRQGRGALPAGHRSSVPESNPGRGRQLRGRVRGRPREGYEAGRGPVRVRRGLPGTLRGASRWCAARRLRHPHVQGGPDEGGAAGGAPIWIRAACEEPS
uniref:Uncharacterized protein n=1 Tax=Tetraselmis sp. GSL018 TaxID=582737 RepID=A0A061SNA0_9CHLO